jgi:hypothetical protein
VASQHWPRLSFQDLEIISRDNTGVGRFVDLRHSSGRRLADGIYECRGHIVEMEGVDFGIDFAVCVVEGRIDHLELVTCSPSGWDGVERPWKLVRLQV